METIYFLRKKGSCQSWHEPEPAVADGVRECSPVPGVWLDTRILLPAWVLRPCTQRGRRVGTLHNPHLPRGHQGSWDHSKANLNLPSGHPAQHGLLADSICLAESRHWPYRIPPPVCKSP